MGRDSGARAFGGIMIVCALGALYPIANAVAHRSEALTPSLKPAGVQADVIVMLRARSLTVAPAKLNPGKTIFYVVNKTATPASMTIAGPGVAPTRTARLGPGRNATLTVKLKRGTYKLSTLSGAGASRTTQLTVYPASLAPPDNGSTNQPPDGWWEMCGGI